MESDFWLQRWDNQQIGFHLNEVNPILKQYAQQVFKPAPVFVPLCGKTLDMPYLVEQQCPVVGVELSELALDAFEQEQSLLFQREVCEQGLLLQNEHYRLYQGDFFKLTGNELAGVHQVYDRAALVALPEDLRNAYVQHLLSIMPRPFSMLLVTFEYPQKEMSGPPFSVSCSLVESLFADAHKLERIHYTSILEQEPRFQAIGVTELYEAAFVIEYL
ncbi:thiopurine S-methyltransferase [Pleionea sp. CnH1-48]|uniref:thiopurine S-methyltransferase n=1 Tax=Pleionea sp. CnH1-48 TaxID=2954494 RepID=UPI002096A031|nr:thiopurine S-methyltransferase [Pleionea sp. CnH1-48]MCO7225413.1 thiopurine S-methyltransferase [Pleionea sp. CnH1-48]